MPELKLNLSDADYADVLRILSEKEKTLSKEQKGITNSQLFAAVCREWEPLEKERLTTPPPTCPTCQAIMVKTSAHFRCIQCGEVYPIETFIPIRIYVTPSMFSFLQQLRQKADVCDLAELTNITWSLYGLMLDAEKKGGFVFMQESTGKQMSQRLNLRPHKEKSRRRG